jgi:hypothetical protein
MVIVIDMGKVMSLDVRGQIGFTSGCGLARCGYSRCGASKDFGGIYQRKKTLAGWRTSRMRYYRPTNPQTEPQQDWRAELTAGWEAYSALTSEEKVVLSRKARLLRMSGPNLFMRKWLKGEI